MQVRDLIAELQRYEPTQLVKIAVAEYDDGEFTDVAEVGRESLFFGGNCVVLHPYNE